MENTSIYHICIETTTAYFSNAYFPNVFKIAVIFLQEFIQNICSKFPLTAAKHVS